MVCTSPPIPVRLDKQQVLVYELHVTNFDVVPLTLKHVEVFAGDESTGPVASLDEKALAAAMIRVGIWNDAVRGSWKSRRRGARDRAGSAFRDLYVDRAADEWPPCPPASGTG